MDRDSLDFVLQVMKDEMESGHFGISDPTAAASFEKLCYADDGKVDLETVDDVVRSCARMFVMMKTHNLLQETPLREIQEEYFRGLEEFYEGPLRELKKHNVTPHDIASFMADKPDTVKVISAGLEALAESIQKYWEYYGPIVELHLDQIRGLKAVYGGDIFPPYTSNTVPGTSLYVETSVLPDPLLRTAMFHGQVSPEAATYYSTKHALSMLTMKDIVLANVDTPIAVIAPDYITLDDNAKTFISEQGSKDARSHLGYVFDRHFSTEDELDAFLEPLCDFEDLAKLVKHPERILFDIEWERDFRTQWNLNEARYGDLMPGLPKEAGQRLKYSALGRMMQCNEIVFKSLRLGGCPLIDAPTSWQFLEWKYEYDGNVGDDTRNTDAAIVNALQHPDLAWLSSIPRADLIRLRQEGTFVEIRDAISAGISEITLASPSDFESVTSRVLGNIDAVLTQHGELLKKRVIEKAKFLGLEVGSWLGVGAVGVMAACTGNLPLTVIATVLGITGVPSGKDLWQHGTRLLQDDRELRRSPAALLFNAKKVSKS